MLGKSKKDELSYGRAYDRRSADVNKETKQQEWELTLEGYFLHIDI